MNPYSREPEASHEQEMPEFPPHKQGRRSTANQNGLRLTTGFLLATLTGALVTPGVIFALPSDRQKPIEIKSDSADIDNKKGISIYRGDAVMIQGTTRITGDIITIYTQKREVTEVIAQGNKNRAYYEEQQPDDQGTLQAWGYTIKYEVTDDRIELIRNAQLSQKGDTFKGEEIHYNLTQQTVNAKGAAGKDGSGRVQMVIQPKQE